MRIYVAKAFRRFQRRAGITDATLCRAVRDADNGLVDADLGGGLIKLRVARKGKGKSGGYRVLLAYRAGRTAVFIYGFAKSDRDNIDDDELDVFRQRARALLAADDSTIKAMLAEDKLRRVDRDEDA